MEEAAQVLEVETLIPMLLQKSNIAAATATATPATATANLSSSSSSSSSSVTTASRLKRVVLIGDHHQLPPVVKHAAFQRHAHLDQVNKRLIKQASKQVTATPGCRLTRID